MIQFCIEFWHFMSHVRALKLPHEKEKFPLSTTCDDVDPGMMTTTALKQHMP